MGGTVHWFDDLQYHRAMRRKRIIRDRLNPLDMFDALELYQHYRLPRQNLFRLIDEIWDDHQYMNQRNAALCAELR